MAINVPLQVRAGLNVGVENGPAPFLLNAGSREVEINPVIGSEVVILECPPGVARSPLAFSDGNGWIFNTTIAALNYDLFFEDDQGNRMSIQGPVSVASGGSPFEYGIDEETAFILNPGEKIILVTVT